MIWIISSIYRLMLTPLILYLLSKKWPAPVTVT